MRCQHVCRVVFHTILLSLMFVAENVHNVISEYAQDLWFLKLYVNFKKITFLLYSILCKKNNLCTEQ